MTTTNIAIASTSGHEIMLTVRTPNDNIKGIVQINTGTCIPQKIYWKFAEYMTKNGYVTITYDYTDADNYQSNVTHAVWLKDIESVTAFIIDNYPTLKKYAVGHSSGGQFIGYTKNATAFEKIYLVACANGYVKNLSLAMRIAIFFLWKIIVPFSIWKYGYMNNAAFGISGGFPKQIILELRSWCYRPDFFTSYFEEKKIPSYYHTITAPVKAFHLADDAIANRKSCRFILDLYTQADKSIETLYAADYDIKKFGHRGFFFSSAEKLLWPKFLKEMES
ncbi:MAG: hypothetical protein IT275_08700 [Chitinophagales bacterium]|nr:hypothetical protein [Chitinophagales bacterium]HMW13533.1 hypothetical protein [Chitinophagales bacterium]HMZ33773.1 hypothetical protein [Chitinophagales bacterium]HNC72349.1 hypothetical protein [Chitinophagales bacterium]HND83919.1 hypothetical protein [Chitinophagales bacterium]